MTSAVEYPVVPVGRLGTDQSLAPALTGQAVQSTLFATMKPKMIGNQSIRSSRS